MKNKGKSKGWYFDCRSGKVKNTRLFINKVKLLIQIVVFTKKITGYFLFSN